MAQASYPMIRITGPNGAGLLTLALRYNDQNMRVVGVDVSNTTTLVATVDVTYADQTTEHFDIPAGYVGNRGFNRNLTVLVESDPETGETGLSVPGIVQWAAGFVVG